MKKGIIASLTFLCLCYLSAELGFWTTKDRTGVAIDSESTQLVEVVGVNTNAVTSNNTVGGRGDGLIFAYGGPK